MFASAMNNTPAFTENMAVSNATTYSNTLNMFFKFVRKVDPNYVKEMVKLAYSENKLTALKVIFHRRDCRGGVGERHIFRIAIVELFKLDRATVLTNLRHIPLFGRWDDIYCLMPYCEHEVLSLVKRQLELDIEDMNNSKTVSLCAKWVPSEKGKLDKIYGVYFKLAHFMNISPMQLRKNFLTPLRNYLNIVEKLLTAQEYDLIKFESVPSQAMLRLKKAFAKKCPHWESYLEKLKQGKTKVNAELVDPYQLVKPYILGGDEDPVIEAQWKVKEQEIIKMGGLSKSLALVDVSASMFGDNAILVAVSLGLLVSRCTSESFKNCVMTFESMPQFIQLKENKSLKEAVSELAGIPWGGSTDFMACFELVLQRALSFQYPANHAIYPKRKGLAAEDMPDKIICISDMQFNAAGDNTTNLESVKVKYRNANYAMPKLVFWNVRANTVDFPATQDEENVALISGFNVNILKSICQGNISTPFDVMMEAINDTRYDVLEVYEPFELI